jgi:hypothetical protein
VIIVLILLKVFGHKSRAVEIFFIDQFALSNTSSVAPSGIGTRAALPENPIPTLKRRTAIPQDPVRESFSKLAREIN